MIAVNMVMVDVFLYLDQADILLLSLKIAKSQIVNIYFS